MARRLTVAEFKTEHGHTEADILEIVRSIIIGDENAPALCSDGCEVEPDGTCPHGNPSILIELGMI